MISACFDKKLNPLIKARCPAHDVVDVAAVPTCQHVHLFYTIGPVRCNFKPIDSFYPEHAYNNIYSRGKRSKIIRI